MDTYHGDIDMSNYVVWANKSQEIKATGLTLAQAKFLAETLGSREYSYGTVRRNLMSGKEFLLGANTPLCCDPSSETYWSM